MIQLGNTYIHKSEHKRWITMFNVQLRYVLDLFVQNTLTADVFWFNVKINILICVTAFSYHRIYSTSEHSATV